MLKFCRTIAAHPSIHPSIHPSTTIRKVVQTDRWSEGDDRNTDYCAIARLLGEGKTRKANERSLHFRWSVYTFNSKVSRSLRTVVAGFLSARHGHLAFDTASESKAACLTLLGSVSPPLCSSLKKIY